MKKMLPKIYAFVRMNLTNTSVFQSKFFPVSGVKKWYLAGALFFAMGIQTAWAQTVLTIAEADTWASGDARTTYTYPSGDIIRYTSAVITDGEFTLPFASFVTETSTGAGTFCPPATKRVQVNSFELQLNSTSVSKLEISVTSSGAGIRFFRGLIVNGTTVIANGNDERVKSSHPGGATTCANFIIEDLSIPQGATITVIFGGSATGSVQNVRLSAITITPDPTLPVGLVSFNAFNRGNGVELAWSVSNENEGRAYNIERSTDGRIFTPIKTIQAAGAGKYTYLDNSPKTGRMVYYRLQLVSIDGSKAFSQINALSIGGSGDLQVTPNPVRGNLFLTFNPSKGASSMRILNMDGKVLLSSVIAPHLEQANVNTSKLLPGSYMVQIINGSEIQTRRFVKL